MSASRKAKHTGLNKGTFDSYEQSVPKELKFRGITSSLDKLKPWAGTQVQNDQIMTQFGCSRIGTHNKNRDLHCWVP